MQRIVFQSKYNKPQINEPICVPAGASFDDYLPQHLRYASKDSLETCPYDPNHRVKPTRLRGHIVKCAKNHPPLAICHFNATHRMPAAHLDSHVLTCPSRIDVAHLSHTPNEEMKVKQGPAGIPITLKTLEDDEEWD